MRTYTQTLAAGQTTTLTVNGNFFALIAAANPVDLEFQYVGQSGSTEISQGMQAGYSELFPGLLTSVIVTSATAQTIQYGCGLGQAKFDRSVIVTQQASSITNVAPVTVGVAASLALAAGTTRKRVVLMADPANTDDITLGGPGVTLANGTIVLTAGQSFLDDSAACAAFYAISTAAGQVLRISYAE